jgi:hypothetical protein
MPEERREAVDFWEELDEAEQTVARWPAWQRGYGVDVLREEEAAFRALGVRR